VHAADGLPFGPLLAITEHTLEPGAEYGLHPHRELELLTYVLDGENEHLDDAGSRDILRSGFVRRVSAGTGIWHSERNPSETVPARYIQIWLTPALPGQDPSVESKAVSAEQQPVGAWWLIASPDGRDGSLPINAAVDIWLGRPNSATLNSLVPGAHGAAWTHVIQSDAVVLRIELR
jgi:quercetin 2,3-dioxygenase